MGDESSEVMNLDLNLSPGPEQGLGSLMGEQGNVEECNVEPVDIVREGVRPWAVPLWRWTEVPIEPELDEPMVSSGNGSTIQAGEGSVATEARATEVPKAFENNNGVLEAAALDDKDENKNGDDNDGTFFDCNICLDLARDPVVTCCGHLFCWPCLYRWLHMHSAVKECPVCKGEVTVKNVTPIYGRSVNNVRASEEDSSLKIPPRPQARRVESWRQSVYRNAYNFPSEQIMRQLGSRDSGRVPLHGTNSAREILERDSSMLNRYLTSRGRREQHHVPAPLEAEDLMDNGTAARDSGLLPVIEFPPSPRFQSQRGGTVSYFPSGLDSAETYPYSFFPIARQEEQFSPIDDSDPFLSFTVTNLGSQTVDTAVEIDSIVSQSTSSTSVRNAASRVSHVNSRGSRPTRRRLN